MKSAGRGAVAFPCSATHPEQCVADAHMQVLAQTCRSAYTKIYVPVVRNTHTCRFMPTLPTLFRHGSTVYGHIHRQAWRWCPSKCVEQLPYQKPLLIRVLAYVFISAYVQDRYSSVICMCIWEHLGNKTLSHVHMPSATPTHPSQQHSVCICRCLVACVRVYAKHMTPTESQGHSSQNLSSQAPKVDADPHLPGKATYMRLLIHV